MKDYFSVFAQWDLAAWYLAAHLTPKNLENLRRSLLDDPSFVRDAGMSLGLDRTSDIPPRYYESLIRGRPV